MAHKLYRDETDTGYEEIELDLEQDVIDWLEERAILEIKTVDEIVEDILQEAMYEWEVDDTPE